MAAACRSAYGTAGPTRAPQPSVRPIARPSLLIDEMYEHYTLEFLRVSRPSDAPTLRFEPYDPGPAPETSRQRRRPVRRPTDAPA